MSTLPDSRILVVDDNLELAENVGEILEAEGADVTLAASVAEARALDLGQLDVGLVDVQLPDGSGADLLKGLKSQCPDAEFLLVTGHGTVEDAARAVGTGAYAYILKPFRPGTLIAEVSRAVRQVRSVRELREKEEALRRAQRTESVARLVNEVAHDFNNLLTIIRGYARATEKHAADAREVERFARGITSATSRGAALTRQLLSYSRPKAAQRKVLEPAEVVANLSALLEHVLGPRVTLELDLASVGGMVQADLGQLEQALMNLVINARDAMPNGGHLRLVARREHLSREAGGALGLALGDYAVLGVSDTGIGMDAETCASCTHTFFTTKGDGGTGLGLSTVSSIAREHAGGVRIASSPGKGTTVELLLPIAEVCEMATGVDLRPTVLVVEDEELLRLAACHSLQGEGIHVVEASSVSEAIEIVTGGTKIDVLVTDLRLPDGTGTELARTLTEELPELGVLIMTGLPASETGQYFVLEKPFELEDLPRYVRRLAEREEPRPAKATLLIVEDEPAARFALAELLGDELDVVTAGSGREALDIVRRRHRSFHVLLTDLSLPDMCGRVLAQEVIGIHPSTHVVFMSGHEQPPLPGWASFVPKPIDFDSLTRLLTSRV